MWLTGKTTTAHLVCKEVGMDVVEFNASDTRSQKLMSKEVSELLSSKSLLPFFQSKEDPTHLLDILLLLNLPFYCFCWKFTVFFFCNYFLFL